MKHYDELLTIMENMDIVDSHEHLPPEADRLASDLDFTVFFNHYCRTDMISAGMPQAAADMVFGEPVFPYAPKAGVEQKWRSFEPFYSLIQDGSYCRAAHLSMERLYGTSRLRSLADAEDLTSKMREANKKGIYRRVLRDVCRIRMAVNYYSCTDDCDFLSPVPFVADYAEAAKKTILDTEARTGISCARLDNYIQAVHQQLFEHKQKGMKAVKFHFAYLRDLRFAPRTHEEAERVYNRVLEEGYGWRNDSLGYEESRPLQDYMVHRIIQMAAELDMPVVFHTGLQGAAYQNPDDARPDQLWNLPHRYRNVDFVILHAGIPWMEEAALLAKCFPRVYLDMGWTHLISPSISTRALMSWIDMVPINKIFGFGGDYFNVEKIYGHLMLARQNIARALACKIETGEMSLERARAWIQAILFDNPKHVFRLDI